MIASHLGFPSFYYAQWTGKIQLVLGFCGVFLNLFSKENKLAHCYDFSMSHENSLLHLPTFLHPHNFRWVAQGLDWAALAISLAGFLSFVQRRDLSAEDAAARGLQRDGKCKTIPSTPVTQRIRLPPLWTITLAVFPLIQMFVSGLQSLLARTL